MPRSQRDGAIAETLSLLASAAWLMPSSWRNFSIRPAHTGLAGLTARIGLRI